MRFNYHFMNVRTTAVPTVNALSSQHVRVTTASSELIVPSSARAELQTLAMGAVWEIPDPATRMEDATVRQASGEKRVSMSVLEE